MTIRLLTAAAIVLQAAQAAPPPSSQQTSPLAAAAAAAKAARGEAADAGLGKPVAVTFNWPVGLTATVEAERTRTRTTPAGPQSQGSGLRYRMRVDAHPRGRVIGFDSFEPLRTVFTRDQRAEFEEILARMLPSVIVSPKGEFLGVTDLSKMRAFLRGMLEDMKAKSASVPPDAQTIIDGLTSEEVLTNLAAQDWELFAGVWAGYRGKIGEFTEADSEEPSPVVPDLMIPMRTRFGAARQAPCEPGRPADSCVVMELRSSVAPGGMETVMKALMGNAAAAQGVTFERFDVVTEITAIVDPATARPYRITHVRRTDMTMRIGARAETVAQTEQRTYRVSYQ